MKTKMAEDTMVIAKYDYTAQDQQELNIKKNEKLLLLDDSKSWWLVQNTRSQSGFVPSNYVKKIKPSIFSSIKNTLGRKKNTEGRSLSSPSVTIKASHSDTSEQGSISSETQFCETTPAVVKYGYKPLQPDELGLVKGERIMVIEKSSDGWWKGKRSNGEIGWFPSNYVMEESEDPDMSTYAMPADSSMSDTSGLPVLDVVVTLYQFTRGNDNEELSFDKDERLEIIDRPANDPEWWKARNAQGEVGLVPRNYVQVVTNSHFENYNGSMPQSHSGSTVSGGHSSTASADGETYRKRHFNIAGPFASKDWFYGRVTRHDCDDMLNQYAGNGDFVIRESESNAGDYTVTLKAPNRNKHFRVASKDGNFCIGQQTFATLDELVDHYKRHPIYRHDSEKLYLVKAFIHPEC